MKAIKTHKKVIALAMALLMVAAVTSISAFAATPYTPYFYNTEDLDPTDLPPMGNATVFDTEQYVRDTDYTLFFFQPERYYEPYLGSNTVGVIRSFRVWDVNAGEDGEYVETLIAPGSIAQVPNSYAQTNQYGEEYFQIALDVTIYDVTLGIFASYMPTVITYYRVQ